MMASTPTQVALPESGIRRTAWHRAQLLIDMIVDPAAAAASLKEGHAWLLPWMVGGICVIFSSLAMLPFTQQAILASLPEGTGAAQAQSMLASFASYATVGAYLSPVLLLIKWVIYSMIVYVTCVLLDIRIAFRSLLNVIGHCGLILVLQDVLTYVVIRFREGPIRSPADLLASFGLDLVIHPSSAAVAVLLNYFSLFNLMFLALCAVAIGSLGRTSKTRGFLAMAPLVILQLILVVGITLLQPK